MLYTLWDTETNNLVAECENIEQALNSVRRGIERNGSRDMDTLLLHEEDEHGEARPIASGRELTALAHQYS